MPATEEMRSIFEGVLIGLSEISPEPFLRAEIIKLSMSGAKTVPKIENFSTAFYIIKMILKRIFLLKKRIADSFLMMER